MGRSEQSTPAVYGIRDEGRLRRALRRREVWKPRGRTFTTSAIMAIDAVTGSARIWRVPKDRSLVGNERALDIVRGGQFPSSNV